MKDKLPFPTYPPKSRLTLYAIEHLVKHEGYQLEPLLRKYGYIK